MPRQLLLLARRKLAFREYADAPLKPLSVLLNTVYSAVSHGTEALIYEGKAPKFDRQWDAGLRHFRKSAQAVGPWNIGYEAVARVECVGERVENLKKGDVVWIDAPHRETHIIDLQNPPPFRKFSSAVEPKSISFFALSRVALGAVHDAEPMLGSVAAVFGLGVVGQLCVQLLRKSGVRCVFGVDAHLDRLSLAESFGAVPINFKTCDPPDTIKAVVGAVDFAIEASGSYAGLSTAIQCVAPMGRVVVVSSYGNQSHGIHLGHEFHRNRVSLISSMTVNDCLHPRAPFWNLERLNNEAAQLLEEGALSVSPLISRVLPFNDAVSAFDILLKTSPPPLKILFSYE